MEKGNFCYSSFIPISIFTESNGLFTNGWKDAIYNPDNYFRAVQSECAKNKKNSEGKTYKVIVDGEELRIDYS